MSSLCFVCQLPILSHQTWGTWPQQPDSDTEPQDDEPADEDEEEEDEEDRVALLASTGDNTSSKSDSAACLTSVSSSLASAITRNCRSPQEARSPGDGASADRGCRSRRPSQPVVTPQRRRSSAATATGGPLPDWEGGGDTFHEDCLVCETCGLRLAGSSWQAAHRFQNKIYCGLHYADVTGLSSGEEFLAKLREYKRQSLGCAEARRKSSTTLTFPVPVQACPGTPCEQYPHCIKATPGYWIECAGPKKESDALLDPVDGADSCGLPSNVSGGLELVSRDEDTYERHFYGKEHWNYFTNDEALGPVIMSLRQENINNRDQFRVMLRTVTYNLHGLIPASCVCANRYDREAIVRCLGDEAGLKPCLTLGQLPSTPDELLKLDQVFVKSELKVGVVYVKEGQNTEEQILNNRTHSALFEEFLCLLGDRVRLKGFDKYKGGLDTVHDLTGTESVYTAWKSIEIMFHVSTMLPHEEHDPQKLQKKRHIGNDIVCMVFLEADNTLFSPACIKSHFLHVFIVVRASPNKPPGAHTVYEVSVVSRDEVGAFKPYLWHRSVFPKGVQFREWLLTKIVNGERTSYSAPKFARMQDRTRSQMLEDMVTNLQNHAETGQIPKPYRRGSWRPIGHMRPSSPLLDSVRDPFEGYDQLARDFAKMFQGTRQLCDVVFNVGQGKDKTKVYAVRAILGVRSRVFLEMLYGFSTGFGLGVTGTADTPSKVVSPSGPKSSNYLQVPDIHESPRNKSAPSSPMMIRAFSRLGNWTGWSSRSSSKDSLIPDDIGGLKRWQSECNCKEKEKEKNTAMAGATVTLSVCADAHKVDRNKLCQHEFNIIEFDSDTFQLLVDYLHCGTCPLSCESIPGLICAAEHYDLPELMQACFHHAKQHLRLAVVCGMLNVLENYYWRYTSATELVNMILQFVDTRASALFAGQDFLELSESMFQTIIGRELNIPEVTKFEVMLRWATHHVKTINRPDPRELQCTMNRLTRDLKLYLIPPQELIKVVLPTKTISHEEILDTLLYQADTGMFRVRRSYIEAVDGRRDRYLLSQKLTGYRR
ncbi:uncharacterized protein rsh isoform X1 [Dermacentor albipictus]|uniref:uncharacterized protein rsh isoform X1 n=1 Tax=Dermacentor albipictus TaxID=60249 RepID=UPI0031FD061A